jgi:hypothetical protein
VNVLYVADCKLCGGFDKDKKSSEFWGKVEIGKLKSEMGRKSLDRINRMDRARDIGDGRELALPVIES